MKKYEAPTITELGTFQAETGHWIGGQVEFGIPVFDYS